MSWWGMPGWLAFATGAAAGVLAAGFIGLVAIDRELAALRRMLRAVAADARARREWYGHGH